MSNSPIQILPSYIIDQIKAGEVVERPSSLIKELIENSIDAKASKIDLHIVENGLELIAIQDNGIGIPFDQMPLAFQRHTTSKLNRFEDLYNLSSFGFRGEALASICSVSRLTCTSLSKASSQSAGRCVISGGILESHNKTSQTEYGTSIYIRDLFFNTPARLKFVKSKTSEKNALKKTINAFLVSYPEIEFSIKWDDADKEIYLPTTLPQRISQVVLKKNLELQSHSSCSYDAYNVCTYSYRSEDASSSTTRGITTFINGRYFNDHSIVKMIQSLDQRESNISRSAIIFISAPKHEVDVNVHPNKTQIKFVNLPIVLSLISESIKKSTIQTQNREQSNSVKNQNRVTPNVQAYFQNHNQKHSYQDSASSKQLNLTKLSPTHYLVEHNSQFYLLSSNQILKNILSKYFKNDFSAFKTHVIPLLISTPIICQSTITASQIQLLSTVGFEIEKISTDRCLLKAYPDTFTANIAIQIVQHYFDGTELESLSETNFTLNVSDMFELFSISSNQEIIFQSSRALDEKLLDCILKGDCP